mmetsp:Transcript_132307/g.257812  ORF Transcript_132307/g.257812 Transcript_132307/m.257812 type:complete len:99 (+) Transcript_132307:1-297(+)
MPAPGTRPVNGASNSALRTNGTPAPPQRTKVLQRAAAREETIASKKKDHDGKLAGKKGDMAVPKGPANHIMETPPNQPKENEVPTTKLSQLTHQTFAF